MMSIVKAEEWLRKPEKRDLGDGEVAAFLVCAKRSAVDNGNEDMAKYCWCLEQTLRAQNLYLEAFRLISSRSHYSAWCELERLEVGLGALRRHFLESFAEYRLDFIAAYCKKWQKLFPYKYFLSPGVVAREKKCSICEQRVSIRNPCGHRVGEIYGGKMCQRIVTKADIVEVSVVEEPGHKYSVLFPTDPKTGKAGDCYNYRLVNYVARGLRSPFHGWSVSWTTRRWPHNRFENIGKDEDCPCESGKSYKRCCLKEEGVLRPHAEVTFDVCPGHGLPRFEYLDNG